MKLRGQRIGQGGLEAAISAAIRLLSSNPSRFNLPGGATAEFIKAHVAKNKDRIIQNLPHDKDFATWSDLVGEVAKHIAESVSDAIIQPPDESMWNADYATTIPVSDAKRIIGSVYRAIASDELADRILERLEEMAEDGEIQADKLHKLIRALREMKQQASGTQLSEEGIRRYILMKLPEVVASVSKMAGIKSIDLDIDPEEIVSSVLSDMPDGVKSWDQAMKVIDGLLDGYVTLAATSVKQKKEAGEIAQKVQEEVHSMLDNAMRVLIPEAISKGIPGIGERFTEIKKRADDLVLHMISEMKTSPDVPLDHRIASIVSKVWHEIRKDLEELEQELKSSQVKVLTPSVAEQVKGEIEKQVRSKLPEIIEIHGPENAADEQRKLMDISIDILMRRLGEVIPEGKTLRALAEEIVEEGLNAIKAGQPAQPA